MTRESKIIEITKAIQAAVPYLRMAKYGSTVRDKDMGTGTVLDYIARSESIGRGYCKARVCWHEAALVNNDIIAECKCDYFPVVVPDIGIREILMWLEGTFKHHRTLYGIDAAGLFIKFDDKVSMQWEPCRAKWNFSKPDNLQYQLQDNPELIDFLFNFTQS